MAFSVAGTRRDSDDVARAHDVMVAGSELVRLAAHRSADVRAAVATRLDCPMAALISLAQDGDASVVQEVVKNPSTSDSSLRLITGHRRRDIRTQAIDLLRERAVVSP